MSEIDSLGDVATKHGISLDRIRIGFNSQQAEDTWEKQKKGVEQFYGFSFDQRGYAAAELVRY
jgi:hypothetical protein